MNLSDSIEENLKSLSVDAIRWEPRPVKALEHSLVGQLNIIPDYGDRAGTTEQSQKVAAVL